MSFILTPVPSQPDQIRKDREKKRAQLQKNLDNKLADMHARINQTVEAHTKQLFARPNSQPPTPQSSTPNTTHFWPYNKLCVTNRPARGKT